MYQGQRQHEIWLHISTLETTSVCLSINGRCIFCTKSLLSSIQQSVFMGTCVQVLIFILVLSDCPQPFQACINTYNYSHCTIAPLLCVHRCTVELYWRQVTQGWVCNSVHRLPLRHSEQYRISSDSILNIFLHALVCNHIGISYICGHAEAYIPFNYARFFSDRIRFANEDTEVVARWSKSDTNNVKWTACMSILLSIIHYTSWDSCQRSVVLGQYMCKHQKPVISTWPGNCNSHPLSLQTSGEWHSQWEWSPLWKTHCWHPRWPDRLFGRQPERHSGLQQ